MYSLKNKVAIITGASSGIGKACAIALAKRGANVVLAARGSQKLEEVVQQCREFGVDAIAVQTDVSQEAQCRDLINKAMEKFGRIDILINNAGMSMRALFQETEIEVLRRLMDVNFWGAVYCTKYALPYILKNRGSITGISSIAGFKGLPGRTGYSASKFALNGFLETVRIENLKKGLHVLICAPGFTASNIRFTALTKDGMVQAQSPRDEVGMMQPTEVAEAIASAIEKEKRTLILTRQGKLTVFLNKLFPAWMDSIVYKHMAKEPDSPLK
ncbi:MAG: SDR family oxidoreductase [Bacteroidota bacterium]|nr:SDR family oxidoreductase [Bacteroidota bacterium]